MTPEEILSETESQRELRERVERLRAMRDAGERSDERIDDALCKLQTEIYDACDRAARRIENARRDRDNLSHVLPALSKAVTLLRLCRLGYSHDVASALFGQFATHIGDLKQAIAPVDRDDSETVRRNGTQRNATFAIDTIRALADRLCP